MFILRTVYINKIYVVCINPANSQNILKILHSGLIYSIVLSVMLYKQPDLCGGLGIGYNKIGACTGLDLSLCAFFETLKS